MHAPIDTSAWDDDGDQTPQQLSRYSNRVRLGIPDVAVLRSMERDGIVDMDKILQSLKSSLLLGLPPAALLSAGSSSTSRIEGVNIPQDDYNSSNTISSLDGSHCYSRKDGRKAPLLGDDPNYR